MIAALVTFLAGATLMQIASMAWHSDIVHWVRCEHDAARTTAEIWVRRGIHRPYRVIWTPGQHRDPCNPKLVVRPRASGTRNQDDQGAGQDSGTCPNYPLTA